MYGKRSSVRIVLEKYNSSKQFKAPSNGNLYSGQNYGELFIRNLVALSGCAQ